MIPWYAKKVHVGVIRWILNWILNFVSTEIGQFSLHQYTHHIDMFQYDHFPVLKWLMYGLSSGEHLLYI